MFSEIEVMTSKLVDITGETAKKDRLLRERFDHIMSQIEQKKSNMLSKDQAQDLSITKYQKILSDMILSAVKDKLEIDSKQDDRLFSIIDGKYAFLETIEKIVLLMVQQVQDQDQIQDQVQDQVQDQIPNQDQVQDQVPDQVQDQVRDQVPVNNLSGSIINLTFGIEFDQPIDNLPNSDRKLTYGPNFDQSVDLLPDSIINLTDGDVFYEK